MKRISLITILCLMCTFVGSARDIKSGYRGFVEWDNSIGKIDYTEWEINNHKKALKWFMGLATSHGYQFNQHIYLGAGVMFSCSTTASTTTIPLFADLRYDYKLKKGALFADARGGYYFNGKSNSGLYLSPIIGYSLTSTQKINLNIGFGITLRSTFQDFYDIDGYFVTFRERKYWTNTLFSVKIGFDFQ